MSVENSTFKSRAAAAYVSEPREDDVKAVEAEQAENKAVKSASTKKRAPRKKS